MIEPYGFRIQKEDDFMSQWKNESPRVQKNSKLLSCWNL